MATSNAALRLLPVLAAGLLAACPSYTHMPDADRALVREQLAHHSRRLAVSMYTGPFFRDARYRLLTDQPPNTLDLMRDPRGRRILPGAAEGIIPAGTEVSISEVEFPTAMVTTGRSLLTPRFFTWVYVQIPGRDKLHVLVIRDDAKSGEAFRTSLDRFLTQDDVAAKIARYPEAVRKAIAEKRLIEGMDADAARMAWGWPLELKQRFEDGVRIQDWTYEGGRTLEVRGDRLVKWAEAPGAAASKAASSAP